MKLAFGAEYASVFGIEAKHKAHAEHVQAFERLFAVGIFVLRQQFVVDFAHNFARFYREFHLFLQVDILFFGNERQAVELLFQIFQQNLLRCAVGLLHVVHQKTFEVAGDNPARHLRARQSGGVAVRLHERCQHFAVRLSVGFSQVDVAAFLLDKHARVFDVGIDKRGVPELHALFKFDDIFGIFHPENRMQKPNPKVVSFRFFIAPSRPLLGKTACCQLLLLLIHAKLRCCRFQISEFQIRLIS